MRVYFDTGIFIDYLSSGGEPNALLRSASRRGRSPQMIAADAQRLFEAVSQRHLGATSCLTYYEIEEALYRLLAQSAKGIPRAEMALVPVARSIATEVETAVEFFKITVLDLTRETVRLQQRHRDLKTLGIRAADALHAATAVQFDSELLVSADDAILRLDRMLVNSAGRQIICADTDRALELLASTSS